VVKVKHFRPFFGDDIDICRDEKRLVLPVKLTQPSLYAVPDHRVAYLFAHRETQARTCRSSVPPEYEEMRGMHLGGTGTELHEFRTPAQAFSLRKS